MKEKMSINELASEKFPIQTLAARNEDFVFALIPSDEFASKMSDLSVEKRMKLSDKFMQIFKEINTDIKDMFNDPED